RASDEAAEAALRVPGVFAAFTRAALARGAAGGSDVARKAIHSFNLERSGDVFIVLKPYSVASGSETQATHGTPWNYDAHVPLLLWGAAFRPGMYRDPCQTVDLAPTLSSALGISPPSGAVGSPLTPALLRH